MNNTAEFLAFEFAGKARKATRVRISDMGAVREEIRRERRVCATGTSPEALGILMAQPISDGEVWDYTMGACGRALLLHLCASRADQSFTKALADQMVMENHEFVDRLFVESHVINPTPPQTAYSGDSSKPE